MDVLWMDVRWMDGCIAIAFNLLHWLIAFYIRLCLVWQSLTSIER